MIQEKAISWTFVNFSQVKTETATTPQLNTFGFKRIHYDIFLTQIFFHWMWNQWMTMPEFTNLCTYYSPWKLWGWSLKSPWIVLEFDLALPVWTLEYWKNIACHLHICSGGFTQVSELWPVGLLFFFLTKKFCSIYLTAVFMLSIRMDSLEQTVQTKIICHIMRCLIRVCTVCQSSSCF